MAATSKREHDGDGRAQNRNDVEQAGEHAQRVGVADAQREIDDGAGDSEDEHEAGLAEQPLLHANGRALQRIVEALARAAAEETRETSGKRPRLRE